MKTNLIKNLFKTGFLLVVVLLHFEVSAQISVTPSTLTYTQNFNSYAGTLASLPSGWSASGTFTYRGTDNGTNTTGGAWAFGASGARDLGALTSSSSSDIIYGVSFVNNTGSPITSLKISFNFDQWRNAGGNTGGFAVAGTGALNTSPINSSLATNLNTNSCISSCGTIPSSGILTYTLTGISIANGATYGLTWEDVDGSGSDNPIGIDNFSVTAASCATPTISITGTQTLCAGQTTTLTAAGATTYTWSTSATTSSVVVSPSVTTTYTVTGTTSGCSSSKTATVTVNSNPTLTITGTQALCAGQTTTLTASGATTYTWSTSATTSTIAISPTTTTVYTVTGTNSSSCQAKNSPTVTVVVTPTVSVSGTQTICAGQTTTLTAAGAGSYTWSTSAHTASIVVTPTTTSVYTVTGSNGSACASSSKTVSVTVNGSATLSKSITNINCLGAATGSITLTATGGTTPYSYAWTGPGAYTASSQNISGLAAGNYSVTVTTASGCTSSTVATITQPAAGVAVQANASVSSAACNSGATGSISLNVSGGSTPYSYSWSNGSTSQNLSSLTSAVYSVTVTDASGCTASAFVDLSTLGQKINTFPYVQSFESGAGGWITGAYTQTISGVPNQNINDWSYGSPSKSRITHAGDGSKCWVTGGLTGSFYDFREKSYVQSPVLDLTNVAYPVLSFLLYRESENIYDGANVSYSTNGGSTWSVLGTYDTSSAGCNTQNWYNSSSINYLGINGSEPGWTGNSESTYTDSTSNTCQGGNGSGGWMPVKHCLTGLAGSSCVMLRFNFGSGFQCNDFDGIAFDSVAVSNGIVTSPNYTYACSGVNTLSFTASNNSCIKATSWNWNFGDSLSGSNTSTSTNPTHVFSHPGTFTVSLSTNGACNPAGVYTHTVTVFGPSITGNQAICTGQTTTLTASSASSYTWSTGVHTATVSLSPTSNTGYTITETNSSGCKGSLTTTITVTPSFSIATTFTNVSCSGSATGAINLTTSGGTPPFSYLWGGPDSYSASSQDISGLAAGSYSVLVSAPGGCSSSTVVTIAQPPVGLTANTNIGMGSVCSPGTTGSITLTVNGGHTPYSYSWSNGSTSQNLSGLSAGVYSVTVTDVNGCTATASANLSTLGQKIATFPYTESFESGPSGWFSSAITQTISGVPNQNINDWACGVPAKTHINHAGDGSKCWVTGGLTGSFYDFYEKSYVESPAFDFTSLQYPVLSFLLYRESEYKYDGSNVSYSTDGGSTWAVLGTSTDSTDCDTKNWYNYNTVEYLGTGNQPGWTGNSESTYTDPTSNTCQGGHGSGGWIKVQHCLAGLGSSPCVLLRFNFGSGYQCNNFDGIAFDSVAINNGIATSPNYTYTCSGVNTLSFTASNNSCIKATSWNWNFGDSLSGSNTSTTTNPTHVFSHPGTFTVSLSTNGACNPTGIYTHTVSVFGPTVTGNQAICAGQTTTLTASSATSYTWSTGSHTSAISITPTVTTTYTITETNSSGCKGSLTPTVTVNHTPTVSISGTQTICAGQTTTLTASGANSYSWSTGITTASVVVSPTTTASYSVTGTNIGCTAATKTVTVTVNNGPTISVSGTQTICAGQTTTLTASGATSYSWSTGASTASVALNPVITSTYAVTGTTGGCVSNPKTSTVTVAQTPTITINGNHIICPGQTTTLTASGALTYSWNTGATTASIVVSPTTTTSYSVTGGAGSCTSGVATTTVNTSGTLTVSISSTPTICAGQTATLTASGASTYSWNTGATTASVVVSPTTTTIYTVTGTTSGCSSGSITGTVIVNPIPTVTVSGATSICPGQTTTLTASGASTYSWNTGATTASVVLSPTTTTIYTVTGTKGVCVSSSITSTVVVNASPSVNISGTQTICAGQTTTLTASGASTYSWSTGATAASVVVNPAMTTTYTVTGLASGCTNGNATSTVVVNSIPTVSVSGTQTICAGQTTTLTASGASSYSWSTSATTASISINPTTTTIYTVTGVTNSCSSGVITTTVIVNPIPTISVSGTQTICTGQTTTLTASGATSYSWSSGATTASISVNPTTTTTYTLTGSTNGCSSSALTTTVIVNTAPTISVSGTQTICPGQTTTLTVSGAASYSWSTGETTASVTVSPLSTTIYTVTGSSGGCISSVLSKTVTVNPLPNITISGMQAICSALNTTLTASGASTYSWSTGATTASVVLSPTITTVYSVTGTSVSGCTGNATSTVSVNQSLSLGISGTHTICAGQRTVLTASGATSYTWNTGVNTNSLTINPSLTTVYNVTGSNAGGCIGNATTTVTVNPATIVNVSGDQTICSGQTLTLTATGASSYLWSNGATTNSITVSPITTTAYTVTGVTGICSNSSAVTVPVNITPTITVNGNMAICSVPTTTLTASGADTYTWSTGATTASVVLSPTTTTIYTVSGTSISGCMSSKTNTVSVNQALPLSINGTQNICSGQTTTLTATGATSYTWSTHSTNASIVVSPTSATVYSVTGANMAGCSGTATVNVTVNANLTLSITGTGTICSNQTTTLTASGASNYTWSNGATTSSVVVNPNSTTVYSVTGVDGVCTGSTTGMVTVNQAPVLSIAGTLAICSIATTTLTASGAGTYSWSTGATTASVSLSPSTTTVYTLTGMNSNGCSSTITKTVSVNQGFSLTASGIKNICAGQTTTLTASGASSYTWSTGSNTAAISVSPSSMTIYTVTGTNAGGCNGSLIDTVTVNAGFSMSISGNQNICTGQTTTLTAMGASTYTWNTGSNDASISAHPASTSTYTVTGKNTAGCVSSATISVNVNSISTISVSATQTICSGQTATLTASGASTYTWSTGLTDSSIQVSPSFNKTYTVTGSNAGGCISANAITHVVVNQTPLITIGGAQSICAGQTTTLTAAGSNTYSWSTGNTTSSIAVNPSSTTTYTLTGTTGSCNSSIPVIITVIQIPTVSIAGTQSVCAGNATTLSASGALSYAWSTGATSATVSVNPSSTTVYIVTASNGGGCTSTGEATVTVNQGPSITILGIQSICTGQTTTLTASGANTYTWLPGTTVTNSLVVNPTTTTIYTVLGKVTTGLCTTGSAFSEVVVGQPPVINLDSTASVCSGGVYQINAYISPGSTYTWSPALSGLTPLISTTSNTSYTLSVNNGACFASKSILISPITCTVPSCENCIGSFSPEPGKKYLFTAWVKEESALPTVTTYTNSQIYIDFPSLGGGSTVGPYYGSGIIIDGWQRIEQVFYIPASAADIKVRMQSLSGNSYFDDVRIFPFDGSVKSYVYDPVSRRLVAELDERNYATLYEYDEEGKLLRIKKETERGIMTIQESKSKSFKKP